MSPNQLFHFVEHLYEIHSHVVYGFNNVQPDDAMARCQRWMDAVLPPPEKAPEPTTRTEVEIPGL